MITDVSRIELMLRPTRLERTRIAHVQTVKCSTSSCLEYILVEIDLENDEVITFFYHDDDALMLEKRPLVDALIVILDAFRRQPLRVTVHDRSGRVLERVPSTALAASLFSFMAT